MHKSEPAELAQALVEPAVGWLWKIRLESVVAARAMGLRWATKAVSVMPSRAQILLAVASRRTGSLNRLRQGVRAGGRRMIFSAGLSRVPSCERRSSAWSKNPGAPSMTSREAAHAPSANEGIRVFSFR